MSLGAFICVRNGISLDYSFELAAESLLKVVDELVLCDSDSTDGTKQALQRIADRDPRVKVVNWPWPNPVRESHHWFIKWLRFAQSHVKSDYLFYLDADEVLDDSPECHAALRKAAQEQKCISVDRLNYWRSPKEIIPDGHCCGKWCIRGGPTKFPVVSDEPHHKGEEPIVDNAVREPAVIIHHLGFLRRKEAFYAKAKVVLEGWFGRFDTRLEAGEKASKPVWETECDFTGLLVPFTGYQPDDVQRWLADRGHFTEKYVPIIQPSPDPVIEVTQTNKSSTWSILHCGDLGDVTHCLALCKAMGRVNLYFQDRNSICKRILERLHILQPLLESQGYVLDAKPHEGEEIHWNAGDFRIQHAKDQSLAYSHWLHYKGQKHLPKIKVDLTEPWLTGIAPDPRSKGKVVIHRSPRYHNAYFRWNAVVHHYGPDRIIFLGTQEEHARFCQSYGQVPHIPTKDLLEMAQLIAGSDLFMGNQSVGLAIAEGMKHPRAVELCPWQPDVVIGGGQAWYSGDGALKLPAFAGKEPFQMGSGLHQINYLVQTSMNPRCGWHRIFPEFTSANSFAVLKRKVRESRNVSDQDAHRLILDQLFLKEPQYFGTLGNSSSSGLLETVNKAMSQIKTTLA